MTSKAARRRQRCYDDMEDWGETEGREVLVEEKPTHSRLLGPDGHPLPYDDHPFGFDLSRRTE